MTRAQLIVVGTPIGNLGDWSPRAQQTLATVSLIACEDTRRTGLLLVRHGVANPGMVVMNEHTERRASERVVAALNDGQSVAVVTDAGMPTISDPGAHVVAAAVEAGFEVVVVPGPTAASAALALSGFSGGRFVFEGFLPRKGRERAHRLVDLEAEARMIVLYEAPHRIERTLDDLVGALGAERHCVVAREITKMHEDVWRGPLGEAAAAVGEPRGEYVIVVSERPPSGEVDDETLTASLRSALDRGLSTKDAASDVAEAHRTGRRRVYELATALRNTEPKTD